MADRVVTISPQGEYAFRVMVELGGRGTSVEEGVVVRLKFRWHDALTVGDTLGAWSMIMETPEGELLMMQSLVRAGARVLLHTGNPNGPVGSLRWVGREIVSSEDLGQRLLLIWTEPVAA